MRIGSGEHTYVWLERWGKIPDAESARAGWAHHGIMVSETGSVISFWLHLDGLRVGCLAEAERLAIRPENVQRLGAKLIHLARRDLLLHHPGHLRV